VTNIDHKFNSPPKPVFGPIALEREVRATLPTREAAHHLHHTPQTLRLWATRGDGPIQPLRVGGRLAWPVADIKRVLGVQ
jgi:hypothetical protein